MPTGQNSLRSASPLSTVEREERNDDNIQVGQWYWLVEDEYPLKDGWVVEGMHPQGYGQLRCVTKVGTNFVALTAPWRSNSSLHCRVHISEFHSIAMYEPNPHRYFEAFARYYMGETQKVMATITDISRRFNLSNTGALLSQTNTSHLLSDMKESSSNALVPIGTNLESLQAELAVLKDKTLPELQDQVRQHNYSMESWLSASNLTNKVMLDLATSSLGAVQEKIDDISLYAGIGETCKLVRDGSPAASDEKLALMQRRCFMDEECLLDYELGGIDINSIDEFDRWLSKEGNFSRLLPFPKCMVAFRVRRDSKNYGMTNQLSEARVHANLNADNKFTFLYVRNGEKLYRVKTELEFQEMLFENDAAHIGEPLMAQRRPLSHVKTVPRREYEQAVIESDKLMALAEQWDKDNPSKESIFSIYFRGKEFNDHNPFAKEAKRLFSHYFEDDYIPLDDSHLYFDEVQQQIKTKMKKYNAIALLIQGILDRSEALQPMAKYNLRDPQDFNAALRLVYDAEMVLTYGEAPDFEEYRAELNAKASVSSVWVGQKAVWQQREAEKIAERQSYHDRGYAVDPLRLNIHGNKGPEYLSEATKVSLKAKKATFSWSYWNVNYKSRFYNQVVEARLTTSFDCVLNVSAYKQGDYKRFFSDPRTRMQYLQWAPLLLAAEEYVLNKSK
ncbi:hypothetical protein [Vibrio fluvialis]|uniref:hypothetical protein n=1 Tax=Vibrio fluvialis TaxID=676 RepID=UPI0023A9B128|nr:hypothetical protein [Vibrio fluvialis]MDE5179125.1 hypothetical protein [Vibrio fluvialis]